MCFAEPKAAASLRRQQQLWTCTPGPTHQWALIPSGTPCWGGSAGSHRTRISPEHTSTSHSRKDSGTWRAPGTNHTVSPGGRQRSLQHKGQSSLPWCYQEHKQWAGGGEGGSRAVNASSIRNEEQPACHSIISWFTNLYPLGVLGEERVCVLVKSWNWWMAPTELFTCCINIGWSHTDVSH